MTAAAWAGLVGYGTMLLTLAAMAALAAVLAYGAERRVDLAPACRPIRR